MWKPRDRAAALKPLVFLLCLAPIAWLLWRLLNNDLGADPVAELEHRSGDWALRFLLITLAMTPLRRITGWAQWIRFRRMLGLFVFFYASVHLAVYLSLDLQGLWTQIFAEIIKRPYITVGFSAWLLLLPLTITSTKGMMRRLGRNWGRLHKLIYLIGVLAVLHFYWLVKKDVREPLIYAAVLALLFALRLPWKRWLTAAKPAAAPRT
ncbi:sulfoxide reductase heme-binding subunit YedZ [Pseudolysobacter antarcticus]|uniref:Protein-methionine-sulfoxide reductase heme-binding subunit MsrQ n=1 Tax=Pseudolysobacter antarcticus TaxID=2511995 RepID=A0A411HIL9_9GAMM|nr:protein-methionine-sulfoxide reductase heme-binding subunit MsrQ [Pseudolysobacter antarcticus]QBB70343.1 sulfoxide reductase heme-binding subunit YedZ [Pseudolysobacter antarcticus]